MRKIFTLLLFTLCCLQAMPGNPETRKIHFGGYEREYLLYVPEKYSENLPAGLIICLHGFNRTMNDYFEDYNIPALAESLNLIVIAPQALPEKSDDVLSKVEDLKVYDINLPLSLEAVWGCGLQVIATAPIFGEVLNVTLNKNIDDVGFIHHIISETEKSYNIIPENKFIFGTSMGGYMSYQYALYHGNDLSGLINICGSMGTDIKNLEAAVQLPICDFHSEDDEVVPYSGSMDFVISSFLGIKANVSLCMSKEKVIKEWITKNQANTNPIVENLNYYPSTTGYSVTKNTYQGENEVIHYKMKGASHSYFFKKETDCMDYLEEVAKFIAANSKKLGDGNDVFTQQKQLILYPNPVSGPIVNLNIDRGLAAIYNLSGQKILSSTFENGTINIGTLNSGIYIIQIVSGNESYQSKLIIK